MCHRVTLEYPRKILLHPRVAMGGLDEHKPAMAMVGLQFSYACTSLFTRMVLVQGMSPRVFVVYRQAIATLVMTPIVYFSRWYSLSLSLSRAYNCCMQCPSHIGVDLIDMRSIHFLWHKLMHGNVWLIWLFVGRRNSNIKCSLNLRSFSLIFLNALIG